MLSFNVVGEPSACSALLKRWVNVDVVDRFGPGDINVEVLDEYVDAFLEDVEDAGLTHVML